jgi:hypothetical protein
MEMIVERTSPFTSPESRQKPGSMSLALVLRYVTNINSALHLHLPSFKRQQSRGGLKKERAENFMAQTYTHASTGTGTYQRESRRSLNARKTTSMTADGWIGFRHGESESSVQPRRI